MPEGTVFIPFTGAGFDSEQVSNRAQNIQRTKTALGLVDADNGLNCYNKFKFNPGTTFTKQQVKATPGILGAVNIINTGAAAVFVQFFDALIANVTPGTTVPDTEFTVGIGGSLCILLDPGIAYTTAISVFSSTAEGGATGSATGLRVEVYYA
jgi:hypothetical protein